MPRRKRYHVHWPLIGTIALMVTLLFCAVVGSAWLTVGWNSHRRVTIDWEHALLSRIFDGFLGVWFFVVGASVGSFLNVVAYRLPRGMSINGFSHCPFCRNAIRADDNIPLLGWIRLRGRCRVCRLPIAIRYPAFELLGGAIALILFLFELLSHNANLPLELPGYAPYGMLTGNMDWNSMGRTIIHMVWIFFFVASAMILWERERVPSRLFGVGLISTLLIAFLWPEVFPQPLRKTGLEWNGIRLQGIETALIGGIAGWSLGQFGRMIVGKIENVGNAKSVNQIAESFSWILVGSMLGWQGTLLAALWIAVVSLFIGVTCVVLSREESFLPSAWYWLGLIFHLILWQRFDYMLRATWQDNTLGLIGSCMLVTGVAWFLLSLVLRKPTASIPSPEIESKEIESKDMHELT